MVRQIWSATHSLIASTMVSISLMTPVLAQQQQLTRAEVLKLLNNGLPTNVKVLPNGKPERPAQLKDILRQLDALRTAVLSRAELLFNEGSLARVDQNTTFRFEPGLRRFQLKSLIAMNETIFKLENGTALILSPPGGIGTQIETPQSQISIFAAQPIASSSPTSQDVLVAMQPIGSDTASILLSQNDGANLFLPAQKGSAVMVVHDAPSNTTQVFALTDGDIKVSNSNGRQTVSLEGGQTVAVVNQDVKKVQEFDLKAFYKAMALTAGLAPGQENLVAQEPTEAQPTLNAVREQTLAALRNQARRIKGFTSTFLADALNGTEGDFNGQRGRSSFVIINPSVQDGTFVRTGRNTAVFISSDQKVTNISVNFNAGTATINGNTGKTNEAGLSGNNANGTVIDANGRITRVDVLGVNGEEPRINIPYNGTLTTGIAPDR